MVSTVNSGTGGAGSLKNLSNQERILLGAMGGLIVGIATYPVGQAFGYAGLFIDGDSVEILGFVLRILGTATLGAIWSYVHKPEHDPRRAFQLGIVAPAALAGVIYANTNASDSMSIVSAPVEPSVVAAATPMETGSTGPWLISSALAASTSQQQTTKPAKPKPKQTFIQRLIKGIVGK